MLDRLELLARRARRWCSRSEWAIRLFGLSGSEGTASEPGLVMLQIDGLSRSQMERAMAAGRLPFLRRLLAKQGYRLHSHYSGLPSTTPAVQGELFYGVKSAVPAFSFRDLESQRTLRMFEPQAGELIERRLRDRGEPLLLGGSSYANIYSGGAQEAHYCVSTMRLDNLSPKPLPLGPILLLFNPYSLLRTGVLVVIEFALALMDMARGLVSGHNLWKEIKFLPSRVGICVLLRELVTIGAKIDAVRGLPVIHANFLGYDEQAHRRGPSSRFAHWALKGIDDAVKRIAEAARRSARRDYDLWVYSDHGQERTRPYPQTRGQTIQQAVMKVFASSQRESLSSSDTRGIEAHRAGLLRARQDRTDNLSDLPQGDRKEPGGPVITAMGPVAHVYPCRELTSDEYNELARRLVQEVGVPIVLYMDQDERCRAVSGTEVFVLPDEAKALLGPDHPFAEEGGRDLVRLCRHPDAGAFVLCGWSRDREPVSFPVENGSHAGPGPEETCGFALLPKDAPLETPDRRYIRPADLRLGALEVLGRRDHRPRHRALPPKTGVRRLRVMTYNAHSCVGLDGKLSPRRIARVIAWHNPDVVALQELDVRRARTQGGDQARLISELLWMEYHFNPALRLEEESYGDAIMSRWPMELVKAGRLPHLPQAPHLEPRGALWVTVTLQGRVVHVLNTHFGLRRHERLAQIQALLNRDWLGRLGPADPIVLCGDLNCLPGSVVYRELAKRFRDVQIGLNGHRPVNTWFGRYPIGRIDHIFVSHHFDVDEVEVGDSDLARVSSDHRPLLAQLTISDPESPTSGRRGTDVRTSKGLFDGRDGCPRPRTP